MAEGRAAQQIFTVEVFDRDEVAGSSASLIHDMRDLGILGVTRLERVHVYRLAGELSSADVELLASGILADPILQFFAIDAGPDAMCADGQRSVEVAYNPGVMDPREESIRKAAADRGLSLTAVRTSVRYRLDGDVSDADLRLAAERLLLNKTVQHAVIPGEPVRFPAATYHFRKIEIDLLSADADRLERISREGQLWLSLDEMKAIQVHFREMGRNPTDVELETLAQTWSEHCVHKTLRGDIRYQGQIIHNLLKSTIVRATEELAPGWCLSVFKDNAGVIAFDDDYAICFKVETHNHPSALEPYGGAATGLGGVIRDTLGTGLAARPILNTDVFCFGPPDLPYDRLPKGTLHPRRVFKGVRAGVADYGNRMGIPTANGAVLFDDRYVGNPLVFCGNVGLMRRDEALPGQQDPGDLVLVVGGRTGRDGIHGATFSSGELTSESEVVSASSVQIGNAITEKRVLDVLMQARDRRLFKRITDCGAGGLSSACGEMGEDTGVEIVLDRVPLKYEGLSYTEIWISEAQERMVIAVAPDRLNEIMDLFQSEDVEATVIGHFTGDRRLGLFYAGVKVADLPMDLIHHGLPRFERTAEWTNPAVPDPDLSRDVDLTPHLEAILRSPNVCSKEWVIRQYDHEVQGGSVLKPLVGVNDDGPGDSCIVRPLLNSMRGVVVSNGINPCYGDTDPYWMAASAIDEAIRQIVAVGAPVDRIALLDNFAWGNTARPDRLGALVRACQACYDIARVYETPFISGKDSLNNEYMVDGESICIPHTLLISALAVMPDVTKAVSMDAKAAGNLVYVVGLTRKELGGSHYYRVRGARGGSVPKVDPAAGLRLFKGLHVAMDGGLVRSCHDCSEGGIGVAAAEMAFAGGLGMDIDLRTAPQPAGESLRDDELIFSESNSRFIVEVLPSHREAFESALDGVPAAVVGRVNDSGMFRAFGAEGQVIVEAPIDRLKHVWQSTLAW